MKAFVNSAILAALLGGTSGAFPQGTVLFDNGVLIGNPNVSDPLVRAGDSPLKNAPGSDTLRAQLLYGTSATSLTPHTGLARFRPSTTMMPGTWRGIDATDDLNRSLPIGGPGVPILLQVRVWDATPANLSFDAARALGIFWGESALFSYIQRQSAPADPSDVWMLNFEGFTIPIIPEPSVIGLAIVGAGALFLSRLRK